MRELTVVYRDPASLTDYENNSRTHSPEQIEKLRASIREFGFTNPILLKNDDTTIGAGHARNMAALAEGLDRVPTITLHGLSDAQWRAYVIADNQLALTGSGWDEEALRSELDALAALDFSLNVIGFDEDELALALGGAAGERAPLVDTDFQHADQYAVIVKCADEAEQEARFVKLREEYGADNVKVVVV